MPLVENKNYEVQAMVGKNQCMCESCLKTWAIEEINEYKRKIKLLEGLIK